MVISFSHFFLLSLLSLSLSLVLHANSTFNFTVGELSWLAVVLLLLACLVLHYIPIRVLLLLWGFVKFSRRLLRPHSVPNNEVLDLLSRVPDDDQLVNEKRKFYISIPKIRKVHQMKNIRLSVLSGVLQLLLFVLFVDAAQIVAVNHNFPRNIFVFGFSPFLSISCSSIK